MSVERLMQTLTAASEAVVTPPLLQPADTFVELAGEEFRKRLFVTEDADGRALCLRPDFTIPVCLEHLASNHSAPTRYAYRGKIFRLRRAIGEPEFEQAGTEWIGHADEMATDARLFALAAECAATVGLAPATRIGDANVFAALVEALHLSPAWRRRLATAFGDRRRLAATLARLATSHKGEGIAARLAPALAHVDASQARAIVRAAVGSTGGVGLVERDLGSGRTAEDIAERILDLAAANGPDAATAKVLGAYLELAAPLERAADALAAFARDNALDLDAAINAFSARCSALEGHGIDVGAICFEAGFGRRIGYYSGFVFEMTDPAMPGAEVVAGGRYDGLIALLDPARSAPAIGFSVWLDRLPR